jgi:hypothetical protein
MKREAALGWKCAAERGTKLSCDGGFRGRRCPMDGLALRAEFCLRLRDGVISAPISIRQSAV